MNTRSRHYAAAALAATLAAVLAACSSPPPAQTPRTPEPPPVRQQEASPRERAVLHVELGTGYYERGQMDIAIEELNEAAKLDPDNPRVYNLFGLVYAMLGESAKAEQNFQRALALAPQDSEIRHNWGWFLCATGRTRESIPEFEAALRNPLYRTPETALTNAGRCSVAFGDVAGAEVFFRRALAIAPNSIGANYGLALIAYRSGRLDEARALVKRLVQQPNPAAETLLLGMCIEKKAGDRTAEASFVAQLHNRYPDAVETRAIATSTCQ